MFSIDYNYIDYTKLLKQLSSRLKVGVKNSTLLFPAAIADGYFKTINFSNGLQCLLSDFTLNTDMCLQQNHSDKQFYTIRFDEIFSGDTLTVKIDNDYAWEGKQQRASVLLTSSLFDFGCQAAKGTVIRSINVLIPRQWFAKYLNIENLDKVLEKYLSAKTQSYNLAPFDLDYRTLFNEVMENDPALKSSIIIENRVMMMIEKFLNQLYQFHYANEADKINIPQDEIKRLMEVESYLVKNLSAQPPSISFLSRVAAMSTTSLKNKFKKLYGINLYEYFQKSRMHRAKVLLLSQKYSIKEIGSQLGYSNLSNFAAAFKKEFKRLPSHLLL